MEPPSARMAFVGEPLGSTAASARCGSSSGSSLIRSDSVFLGRTDSPPMSRGSTRKPSFVAIAWTASTTCLPPPRRSNVLRSTTHRKPRVLNRWSPNTALRRPASEGEEAATTSPFGNTSRVTLKEDASAYIESGRRSIKLRGVIMGVPFLRAEVEQKVGAGCGPCGGHLEILSAIPVPLPRVPFARALLPCTCGSRRMLAACLPVICGDYPVSRASLPSSTCPEAGALSLSGTQHTV